MMVQNDVKIGKHDPVWIAGVGWRESLAKAAEYLLVDPPRVEMVGQLDIYGGEVK